MVERTNESEAMFGLVDCNNFYVSCERVFNPRLDGRAVVVLSNNDGCVISRSAEAKALGIPMGEPYFETKRRAGVSEVVALSSNYALYGDMSDRVMTVLGELVPAVEVYSIDEAFLDLRGMGRWHDLRELARVARETVGQWTGIPVGVGMAPTKTLAKLANRLAKRDPSGVWLLDSEAARLDALARVAVGDVWGVGGHYAAKLLAAGIGTAAELAAVPLGWARKELGGVVGERLVRELRGEVCLALEEEPAARQSVACTRSFGQPLTERDVIGEALASFVSRAAERLRAEEMVAGTLTVLLHTSRFAESDGGHQATATLALPCPTHDPAVLVAVARRGLERLFRIGQRYVKTGVILTDLRPAGMAQLGLFGKVPPTLPVAGQPDRRAALLGAMDALNQRFGRGKVGLAAAGVTATVPTWKTRADNRSGRCTTRWGELWGVG